MSRGDECLNCKGLFQGLNMEDEPLLIKIRKSGAGANLVSRK